MSGSTYAAALAAHAAAKAIIQEFSEQHSPWIPDPARPQQEGGALWTIPKPVPHTLSRNGDLLGCIDCGVSVHAPTPPPRPLTPMEASLSRFD